MTNLLNGYVDDYGNKVFIDDGCNIRKCSLEFLEQNSTVSIGENCNISNCSIRLGMGAVLKIGNGCKIDGRIFIGAHSKVVIGDYFTVTGNVYLSAVEATTITIGDDVIVASNVIIRTNDGHTIHDNVTGDRINFSKDVEISDHVWLGDDVAVLKGTKIDQGSVVGMRSVVTKNIPKNSLAVGSPAKIIKNNIAWKR